jgi:hypothetical protein
LIPFTLARRDERSVLRPGDLPMAPGAKPAVEPIVELLHELVCEPVLAGVRTALDLPRLTVTRMAEELGIPRATLEAYRLGTRRMPAAARARLAAYLAEHAAALEAVVHTLRRDLEV